MNQFSIKDVEALTGIRSHTLRAWEERYDFIKPKRTPTKIRYYDDNDLKSLLNVALLNKSGIKISKIARLTRDEIDQAILEFSTHANDHSYQVHSLISCMLRLDEFNFEQIIRNNFTMHGVARSMTDLIFPFLDHIGVLWLSGAVNPAYEHFITNMIRSKLIVATDSLGYHSNNKAGKKKCLLFLPETETHEIGLLFANYYFRAEGYDTMYLGQNLPVEDLRIIAQTYKPDCIFTSVTTALNPKRLKAFFEALSNDNCRLPVLVTGRTIMYQKQPMPDNFHIIKSVDDLKRFV